MEFVFNDVMESTYRVDLLIVGKNPVELKSVQTKLNQWSTIKLLVKYKVTDIGDSLLFEIIRMKGDD